MGQAPCDDGGLLCRKKKWPDDCRATLQIGRVLGIWGAELLGPQPVVSSSNSPGSVLAFSISASARDLI